MRAILSTTRRFLTSEDGPTATEYAVMLALIIVACLAAIGLLGDRVAGIFTTVETELAGEMGE